MNDCYNKIMNKIGALRAPKQITMVFHETCHTVE